MKLSIGMGGPKAKKKRGPAAAFGSAGDEEEEAARRAREVQRQRAMELGMATGAGAPKAPVGTAAAADTGAAAPPAAGARPSATAEAGGTQPVRKKAADYSHLMEQPPVAEMATMGLPMAFGSHQEIIRQRKRTAAELKGWGEPSGGGKAAAAAAAPAVAKGPFADNGGVSGGGAAAHTGRGGPSAEEGGENGAEDAEDEDEDEAEEEYDEDEDEDPLGLPMAQSITLQGHTKRVSALAIDPAGSRCCTGSYDQHAKFWDFNGMNKSLQAFRTVEPWEGHQVRAASYAPSGGFLLIACHKPEASIHDRDGKKLSSFVKGDPYVCDMAHTKGHIGPINAAQWHPTDMQRVITCAGDGSVRLWDSEVMEKQVEVIKVRNARGVSGKGVMVSTCSFSHDGKLVCAGTEDGTLQMWSLSAGGGKSRPHKTVRKAHSFGEITSVAVAPNGHSVASRSFDGTLKVWDLRKFTKPVAEFGGLDNFISETDALFSPSGRYIMTGTSVYNKDTKEVGPDGRVKIVKAATHEQTGAGKLVFVDATSLQIVREVEYPGVSVLRIRWHPRLNQIFVSDGGGNCSVHYTKGLSQKGALFCANKAVAKKTWNSAMVAEVAPDIRNPHALPMFKDEWQKKQQMRRGRDAVVRPGERTKPQMGYGSEAGDKSASTFTSYIMKNIAPNKSRSVDPREAFLRHAKEAEENPTWVSKAYAQTQPKAVFTETTAEQEEEASKKAYLEKK